MTRGLAFWILMLLWLVASIALHAGWLAGSFAVVSPVLLFLLFCLLGWQVFGPPLR